MVCVNFKLEETTICVPLNNYEDVNEENFPILIIALVVFSESKKRQIVGVTENVVVIVFV